MHAGKRGQAIQAIQATLPETPATKAPSKSANQGVQASHMFPCDVLQHRVPVPFENPTPNPHFEIARGYNLAADGPAVAELTYQMHIE